MMDSPSSPGRSSVDSSRRAPPAPNGSANRPPTDAGDADGQAADGQAADGQAADGQAPGGQAADGATALDRILQAVDASTPEQAARRVEVLRKHVTTFYRERKKLQKLGLDTLDDAFDLMLAMKKQVRKARRENERILDAYREDRDAENRHAQGLHDLFEELYGEMRRIHDLLGVETNAGALREIRHLHDRLQAYRQTEANLREIQEAFDVDGSEEETAAAIRSVNEQLETLYREKEALSQMGITSANEAVSMIESMREQLDDMYTEKQSTEQGAERPDDGDTFEQLQALLAREEMLERELGVSDPEKVVEMVKSLEQQLLSELDAESDPESEPDSEPEPESEPESDPAPGDAASSEDTVTVDRTAIEELREHVDRLADQNRETEAANDRLREQLARLETRLGTSHPEPVLEVLVALKKQLLAQHDEVDVVVDANEVAPFVDAETLEALAAPDALAAPPSFDVGAVALDADGVVRFAASAATPLPGLSRETIEGASFFDELVPSARSPLFEGRVRAGWARGHVDARFTYAFAPRDRRRPLLAKIHLYKTPDSDLCWILYAPHDPTPGAAETDTEASDTEASDTAASDTAASDTAGADA